MYKYGYVCSMESGEILHEFSPMEIFCGRQYMTAWCVGQFYRVEKIDKNDENIIFYVR